MSLIITRAALALKNSESNFKLVKFEAHKPKKKEAADNVPNTAAQHNSTVNKSQTSTKNDRNLELKTIHHEVVKFGMSGFDATKKEEAKIALAVSLGAKPPKREYVNYKELMQKRKQEKQKEKEDRQLMISKSIMQTGSKKKKKINHDVGHLLTSYGKVQKKDLKKDNKNVKKKKRK